MFFRKQFFGRIVAWHPRTLHSYSGRVTCKLSVMEALRLGLSDKLVSNGAANSIMHEKCMSSLFGKIGVSIPSVSPILCGNADLVGRLSEIRVPGSRIQEVIFPFHMPINVDTIIDDHESHEVTVDNVRETPAVELSSILKKRHKKMNKHKYTKRRKRDVFKRRHLANIKIRKKQAKERKEERRLKREARG